MPLTPATKVIPAACRRCPAAVCLGLQPCCCCLCLRAAAWTPQIIAVTASLRVHNRKPRDTMSNSSWKLAKSTPTYMQPHGVIRFACLVGLLPYKYTRPPTQTTLQRTNRSKYQDQSQSSGALCWHLNQLWTRLHRTGSMPGQLTLLCWIPGPAAVATNCNEDVRSMPVIL
jgi:hypothetical protein